MKKNILVTGSHRSGSTWTGKVIARAPKVRYIHEPFNISLKRNNSPFKFWFEFLTDSSQEHQERSKSYINSFYTVFNNDKLNEFIKIRTAKSLYHFLYDLKTRYSYRTIFKDPIAIMSTEWIYKNYDIDIVILIRHPAAFVASLKVKGWQFDFNNFLNQPLLMNTYLKDYETLIHDYSKNKKDIIDQGILLWNIIHDTIDYYKNKYSNEWYFVKHEDLSLNPEQEFRKMFSKIGLTVDSNVENYIFTSTNKNMDSNVILNSTEVFDTSRNSKENIKTWQKRLSNDEIKRIKIGTKPVWKKFYTEKDW
ncbi:sulfotransferase domain-containing protein [Tamlana sp. 2_MG-2023]|uniref:sulfotransferase n=1 Tax=unclassified Tamlana TaxID=2614803 RepID=UPI0026E32F9B|nr:MULTISPECIES: sulfotransferase [unclassified Tamlana]MDO6760241.1 sulfotransferase domain-containing protein [Tamlana sp. 2_MG-2023]MDO6790061.1 sulfotransferase domain-containing protein [Tamlana sp. 1_MG-2023]